MNSHMIHSSDYDQNQMGPSGLDSNTLAQVARINFSRLDLNSFVQIIYKNVFGLSLGALEIVLLIFLEILPRS